MFVFVNNILNLIKFSRLIDQLNIDLGNILLIHLLTIFRLDSLTIKNGQKPAFQLKITKVRSMAVVRSVIDNRLEQKINGYFFAIFKAWLFQTNLDACVVQSCP